MVAVWVRSNGETRNLGHVLAQVGYQIDSTIPPVTGATFTPDIPSPQPPNTPITFTAATTGGQPPAEFKWWLSVERDGVERPAKLKSPSPTLIWAPSIAGSYRGRCGTRSVATTDARQALKLDYQIDTGPPDSTCGGRDARPECCVTAVHVYSDHVYGHPNWRRRPG